MFIHGKPFSDLDETDLISLINNQVAEGKSVEYKSLLPGYSDRDKKEFLADVSSFSNSAGGYLFLRLENLLRDAIAPRLPGLNIRSIALENRNGVKSTVDPCSKLIRVKSRLDPSNSWQDRISGNCRRLQSAGE